MAFTIVQPLPSADAVREECPVSDPDRIQAQRADIRSVLDRSDPRLMVLVGPCSAYPSEAVLEYADRLARLQEEVQQHLLLVMRTYIQKPRTTIGWPGPLNQPDPMQPADIPSGIRACRTLLTQVAERLPIADEMLFPHNDAYFTDVLSYVALGARSAEDMDHRYVASGFDIPVGVKNPTSGDIEIGVNSVQSVQAPHVFAFHGNQVQSSGNPYAHLILRGGNGRPNYDSTSLALAERLIRKRALQNPAIMIDASHDNSLNGHGKDPELQRIVLASVLEGIRMQREEYAMVVGFMLESFLLQGNQKISPHMSPDGLSITDPCLGWEATEELLRRVADSYEPSSPSSR